MKRKVHRGRYWWRKGYVGADGKRVCGEWITFQPIAMAARRGPIVIGDVDPYRSMVTGETIGGRRQHRDHLRAHEMVEVGNDRLPDRKPAEAPSVREDIRRSLEQMGGLDPTPRTRDGWREMIEKGRGRDVLE